MDKPAFITKCGLGHRRFLRDPPQAISMSAFSLRQLETAVQVRSLKATFLTKSG